MTAPYIQLRTDIRKDERVDALAEIAGYTAIAGERGGRRMAIGALVELWTRCSDRGLQDAPDGCDGYVVSEPVIRQFLGPRGVEAILADGCDELALGVRRDDGLIYLRGTNVTVAHLRTASAGGRATAERSPRSARGRYRSSENVSEQTNAPAGHQPAASETPAASQPTSSDPRSQIPDPRSADPESALPRGGAHAIAPTTEPVAQPAAPPRTAWHRHSAWWTAMLDADARLRAAGVEPNAPELPRGLAPGSPHERAIAACERNLAAGGLSADEVDAKMRHIVAVAEAEAVREQHRRWFKPSVIWDEKRAARAADTSLAEASAPRTANRDRAGPRGSAERAPVTGRVEPAAPEAYATGELRQ